MLRRIYTILLVLALIAGFILYFFKDNVSANTMMGILFFLSMLFIASVHGIIAHSIRVELKGRMIVYPVLMGILFGILFFFFVFVVIPWFFPDFMRPIR